MDIHEAAVHLHRRLATQDWFKKISLTEAEIVVHVDRDTPRWMIRKIPRQWCGYPVDFRRSRGRIDVL